jgi:hypothetical protein
MQFRGRSQENFVALPASQNGNHPDKLGGRRLVQFLVQHSGPVRLKPRKILSGGKAGRVGGRELQFFQQTDPDAFTGGEDVIGQMPKGQSAENTVRIIDFDVAGPEQIRHSSQPTS